MDFVQEGGSFKNSGEAANGTCSVLIVLVGRAHGGLNDIVKELGS